MKYIKIFFILNVCNFFCILNLSSVSSKNSLSFDFLKKYGWEEEYQNKLKYYYDMLAVNEKNALNEELMNLYFKYKNFDKKTRESLKSEYFNSKAEIEKKIKAAYDEKRKTYSEKLLYEFYMRTSEWKEDITKKATRAYFSQDYSGKAYL